MSALWQRWIGMQAENDVFVFLSYVEERSSLPQFSSPNKIGSDKTLVIARSDVLTVLRR